MVTFVKRPLISYTFFKKVYKSFHFIVFICISVAVYVKGYFTLSPWSDLPTATMHVQQDSNFPIAACKLN